MFQSLHENISTGSPWRCDWRKGRGGRSREEVGKDERGRKMMGGRNGVEVQVETPGGRGKNRNNREILL